MQTIMHITEVSSGGILPIIAELCNGLIGKYKVVLVYGIRFDTPANIGSLFDERVKLVPVKEFTRKLSLRDDLKVMKKIRVLVDEYQPDVVHFHSSKAGYVGRLGLLKYKCLKLYSPHGYSFLKPDNGKAKKIIYYLAEMVLARTGCITITCGKDEYRLAKRHGIDALCVENGLDVKALDKLVTASDKEEFVVYTVGRIGPQKNPVMFNELAKRLYPVPFIWIGGGNDNSVECLKSPNIQVTGVLERKEVIERSQHYSCYVSCSPSEGLPIALLEAMYLKRICVVTNVAGNKELIDDSTGYLFDDIDRCELLLREIMKNDKAAKEKTEQARNRVLEQYTMEKMCRAYEEIIVDKV